MSIHFNPYLYRSVGCFCTLHTISVQKCMMFLYISYHTCTKVFDVSVDFIPDLYRSV